MSHVNSGHELRSCVSDVTEALSSTNLAGEYDNMRPSYVT